MSTHHDDPKESLSAQAREDPVLSQAWFQEPGGLLDFDARRRKSAKGSRSLFSREDATALPPQQPRPEKEARDKIRALKEASLRKLLGAGPLSPPMGSLKPPDFSGLDELKPGSLPDGMGVPSRSPSLKQAERILPPPPGEPTREKPGLPGHWERLSNGLRWHQGKALGSAGPDYWAWMLRAESSWWLRAGEGILYRHQDRWWNRKNELWFLIHEGEPWAWKKFDDWRLEGLVHPNGSTRIIYSRDRGRVAVVTPGVEAVLFDLKTGQELGRWDEALTR